MSMNLNDLVALASAGYTKEEIAKLAKAKPEENPEEKPEEKHEEKPEEKPGNDDAVLKAITALSEKITALNLNNANQPKEETTEDIIASIINPKGV